MRTRNLVRTNLSALFANICPDLNGRMGKGQGEGSRQKCTTYRTRPSTCQLLIAPLLTAYFLLPTAYCYLLLLLLLHPPLGFV